MINRTDRDGVAILQLNHGKASALDIELCEELQRQFATIAASDIRAVVLTGTGSIFSAGVDLIRLTSAGDGYVRSFFHAMTSMFADLFLLPRPLVAAVNGHAIAGGCIFTAAADLRFMAAGKIGVPELLVGVPFPALALEILRFAFPPEQIEEMIYTGRTVSPQEALERGLIDEVVDPDALLERAVDAARKLGDIPRDAFRLTKKQLRAPYVAAARALAGADAEALELWSSKSTHDHIRGYLDRTIGKKS